MGVALSRNSGPLITFPRAPDTTGPKVTPVTPVDPSLKTVIRASTVENSILLVF